LSKNLPADSSNSHYLSTYKEAARLCGATEEEFLTAIDSVWMAFTEEVFYTVTKNASKASDVFLKIKQLQKDGKNFKKETEEYRALPMLTTFEKVFFDILLLD